MFVGSPTRDEIIQGGIGTCYFLSAIAATAEWPDLIKNVFLN